MFVAIQHFVTFYFQERGADRKARSTFPLLGLQLWWQLTDV